MDLSVVIVNWKVRDLLDKCLASVYAQTHGLEFEVFVVDNDSRDGSVEMVLKKYPAAHVIANNRNVGFAAANNQAIAQAVGEFVLLLNPDTEIRRNALAEMVAFMRRVPQAGIAGPKLLNADGSLQPSVRRFPTLMSQVLLMLKVQILLPKLRVFERRLATDFDYSKEQPCDQVMGAAFVIRRSVLEAIGGLDEGYWIWFEEVDYCKMAAERGFQTWYTPTTEVIHYGGESFGQVFGPKKQTMFDRSARRYFLKHQGRAAWVVLILLRPVSALLAWLGILPKSLGKKGMKV